jgi:hypothetical protein
MERQLTLIDVDENPFVVSLKDDRIQLCAVDSRPELEASELRVFATALFATYAASPLVGRLDAACAKINHVRDKLALTGAPDELVAALDGALCALADARTGMTAGAGPGAYRPALMPPAAAATTTAEAAPTKPARRSLTSSSCRLP